MAVEWTKIRIIRLNIIEVPGNLVYSLNLIKILEHDIVYLCLSKDIYIIYSIIIILLNIII
jgi:hypothetical protein